METEFYLRERARFSIALSLLFALTLVLGTSSGCALMNRRNDWTPPGSYCAARFFSERDACLSAAESQYIAGQQAEDDCNPACIDYYFAAATLMWPDHEADYVPGAMTDDDRPSELYRASVRSFIESAVRFGRFNRQQGVVLASGRLVRVSYQGFVWQPDDFSTFMPVGSYESHRLSNRYACSGVGVPFVVLTTNPPRHPFARIDQPFAATALLAPNANCGGGFALTFFDPLRTTTTATGQPIARDLTAPIAYAATHGTDGWLDDFLQANSTDPLIGLHMREPFQAGKIPIVLVHGLASDPLTWAQLENDLRAQPEIFARYQFWIYRYDTGDPFLSSAARLRKDLVTLRQVYDPMRCDPALSRMVLIGHSMGGLVSKLQVTYSGDILWQAAATQPFNTIVTDPTTRSLLAASFFFQPSNDITRVIYIATPHRGSSQATRCVGRISSALVKDRPEAVARHAQLVRDNPCAFRPELQRGIPTSIDLLEPDSVVLQATDRLPYRNGVALHSIIGDDRWTPIQGASDGVVAVSSARLGGGQSELVVDAKHTEAQRVPETVREVICILNKHAASP